MSGLQRLIAVICLTLAWPAAVMAQDYDSAAPYAVLMDYESGMLLYQNGTMVSVATSSKMHVEIMAHAKPYTGGFIFASGGHLYTVENVRMADGKMLYDTLSPGNPNYMAQSNR